MKKLFNRKTLFATLAIVLVVALALGGTYAWQEIQQHKTNMAKGTEKVNVTLNDSYTPPANWKPGQTVNKVVSVTNLEDCSDPAYVRLQFKEYFEHFLLAYVVDGDGNKLLFATYADGENIGEYMTWADAVTGGYDYEKYTVTYYDGSTADFALTNNEEIRDGIYGKPMQIFSDWTKFGAADKADYPVQDHDLQKTDECDYNVYLWGTDGIESTVGTFVRDYISWTLGTDVQLMSEWIQSPTLGDFWILDEADGWAYWANPIAPGTTTADIMKSMTLDQMAGEAFEYYLHIDMEAVSLDEMDDAFTFWFEDKATGAPADVSDNAETLVELFKEENYARFSFVLDTAIDPTETVARHTAMNNEFTSVFQTILDNSSFTGNNVKLGILDHEKNNFYIDWGDGTRSDRVTYAAGNLFAQSQHTYATAGEYTVTIVGNIPRGINFANMDILSDDWTLMFPGPMDEAGLIIEYRLVEVLSPLPAMDWNESIELDGNNYELDEILYATFLGCLSLDTVPENLFVNNPQLKILGLTFFGAGLESIPVGLFNDTPQATNLRWCFNSCVFIEEIPEDLFANCLDIVSFEGVFGETHSIKSIPANLFANNTKAENFVGAFWDCDGLTAIPANLLDNNRAIQTLEDMFWHCDNIAMLPEWWLVPHLEAATHWNVFCHCYGAANHQDACDALWAHYTP